MPHLEFHSWLDQYGESKLMTFKVVRWLTKNGSKDGIPQDKIKPIKRAFMLERQISRRPFEMDEDIQAAFEKALEGRKATHQWWIEHQNPNDKAQVEETERHKKWINVMQEVFDKLRASPNRNKGIVKGQKVHKEKTSGSITSPAMASNSRVCQANLQETLDRMPVMAGDVIDDEDLHHITKNKNTPPKGLFSGTSILVQREGGKAHSVKDLCSLGTSSQSNTVRDTHGTSQDALKNLHGEASEPSADPPSFTEETSEYQDDEGFQLVTKDKRTQPKIRFPGIRKSSGYTWE